MREYGSRLWSEDAGRAAELAYLDRIVERLENLEALATAGILIVAVLFVIWFL